MKFLFFSIVLHNSLRCVICREKILRLKQHHKRVPRSTNENRGTSEDANTGDLINVGNDLESSKTSVNDGNGVDNRQRGGSSGGIPHRLPNSASNYSISNSRLSASSSNQSFASGYIKFYEIIFKQSAYKFHCLSLLVS